MAIISRHDLYHLPPLHKAAANGDVAELTRLLAEAGIESRDETHLGTYSGVAAHRDLTPLMVAAGSELSNVASVRALLERGADPRAVSGAGVDALWYAAGSGDAERVAVLLTAGGRPDAVASDDRSTATVAARAGGADALRLLLEAGAPPHPPDNPAGEAGRRTEEIPLFAAAAANAACVQLLLDAGAQATIRDHEGNTALMFAGDPAVVPLLLDAGCPRDARNAQGIGPLDAALYNHRQMRDAAMLANPECGSLLEIEPEVQRRQAAVAATLLDAGADSNGRDPDGRTPLLGYCVTAHVSAKLVRLLLERGADLHARDAHGQTALHLAAQNHGHPWELADVIRVLVEAGLPVDALDARGRTPLHGAVAKRFGDRRVIEQLLDLGADLEARDADGLTTLLLAAGLERRSHALVRCLLERGANREARTPDGRTAADLAARHVARLEESVHADQVPADPAQAIAAAAQRRLEMRAARITLQALAGPDAVPPTADGLPDLPEPIWLGYRPLPRRDPLRPCPPEVDHVAEVCSFGHAYYSEEANRAACYPAPDMVPASDRDGDDGNPLEVYAYRAIPLVFDHTGVARPLTAAELLGPDVPPPAVPDRARFTRLGYDVTEFLNGPNGWWTGCSPLSPYCNGMYVEMSALVNRHCLVEDLAAAYDLAVLFGVQPPEPGPYVIVEVWRASDPFPQDPSQSPPQGKSS